MRERPRERRGGEEETHGEACERTFPAATKAAISALAGPNSSPMWSTQMKPCTVMRRMRIMLKFFCPAHASSYSEIEPHRAYCMWVWVWVWVWVWGGVRGEG